MWQYVGRGLTRSSVGIQHLFPRPNPLITYSNPPIASSRHFASLAALPSIPANLRPRSRPLLPRPSILHQVFIASSQPSRQIKTRSGRFTPSWHKTRRSLSDGPKPPPNSVASAGSKPRTAGQKGTVTNSSTNSPTQTSDTLNKTPRPAAASTAPAANQILERLSHIHRPTKEEVLSAASGFWSRLAVRFKWFSIRSLRPYNLDEIIGFASWIFFGHFIWLLIGTTTFFSLVIWMVNTVVAQEALAKWIGGYFTKSSGLQVVFESAIVPKWNDGVISFGKVFVSRRPGTGKSKISKGSQAEAAAAANTTDALPHTAQEEEDGNYTQFDITIDTVNVTLSFAKWFNGRGLLDNVEMKGIRGVIDRTHVKSLDHYVDPRSYKHQHDTGDFELDSFKMEDLLVTVYQPDGFRPFQVSIFSCQLPRLRQQWLFYDFMSASTISGSVDNSLFTLHPRQTHTYGADPEVSWKKQTRLRIDGLNIDHLNRGAEGPFSWIREGNADIIADILLPNDDDDSVAKVLSEVLDRVEATVTTNSIPPTRSSSQPYQYNTAEALQTMSEGGGAPHEHSPIPTKDNPRYVIMDIKVHLNDVRAAVPLFTTDISYINNALIRPIVAYINTRRTFIPINCRVVKERDEFDGSWTMFDSGLLDDLNRETYDAFVHSVMDDAQARRRRIKKVGVWTLQLAAQALFVGMAGNFA